MKQIKVKAKLKERECHTQNKYFKMILVLKPSLFITTKTTTCNIATYEYFYLVNNFYNVWMI